MKINLELYLQNSNTGKIYDVSHLIEDIEITHDITGEAGKLSGTLQRDPNNLLQIANGSIVSFIVNKVGFFFGYIFKINTDETKNYKITCYDQLRYLKNNDVYTTSNMTASQIFEKICKDYGLRYKTKVPTNYVPKPYVHDNKSLYTIIKRGMDLASINDNAQYFIADRFGELTWSEISYEKTNIQLGGGSLVTGFNYEKSIDEDTYNQIKLYRDDKNSGKRDIWIVKNSDNIKKWGTLQYLKKADDDVNPAQIRQTAENYLKVKNRETETLKLEAEGVLDLTIGKGIKFVLPQENIDKWMWITNSTHKFTKNSHTMSLEVSV